MQVSILLPLIDLLGDLQCAVGIGIGGGCVGDIVLLSSSSVYTCDAGTLVGASFATAISCGTMHSATRQMTQADRMLVVRLP